MSVSKGANVTMQCTVYGYPRPTISWFKDDVPLQMSTHIRIKPVGSLVITKVRRNSKHNDEGVYHCFAFNEHGKSTSQKGRLSVKCKCFQC